MYNPSANLLLSLALALSAVLLQAQAASCAPNDGTPAQAVQYASYQNTSDQAIEVITLADGGIVAVIAQFGKEGMDFLASHGIELSITSGHIMGQKLAEGVRVITAPRTALPADISTAARLGALAMKAATAQAVQLARHQDASGQVIEIITLADGGIVAVIAQFGKEGMDFLASHGIELSITSGHIMGQKLAEGVRVITAPRAALPADISTAARLDAPAMQTADATAIQPTEKVSDQERQHPSALPSNEIAGSGPQSQQSQKASGNRANFNDKPTPFSR